MKYHIFYTDEERIRTYKPYIGGCYPCPWKQICQAKKSQELNHYYECVFTLYQARCLLLTQKTTDIKKLDLY